MKHIIVLFFAIGSCLQANSQTTAKSILAEFGYTNISKDSIVLYSMFGHTRYRVYEDDQYIKLESFQNLSAEESAKIGPTIKSLLVKDRSDNEVYLCISYDTLHIRMQGGEKERSSFQSMAESFNSSNGTTYGTGQKTIDIQGFNCSEWMIKGTYSDTISSYIASQIKLDPSIHDFPLYLSSNGIPKGLMLGRDEKVWNGQTIEFRALKLEINQAQDISAELAAYQLVSKEKGDQLLKALFTQMMGIPQNEGKNK